MPNHITNRLTVKAEGERLEEILAAIQNDSIGRGSIDFNKLIPMPESLNIQSGSETNRAISAYLTALNPHTPDMGYAKIEYAKLQELQNRLNSSKMFGEFQCGMSRQELADAAQYRPIEDVLELGKTAVDNFLQYGSIDWYHWCNKNWGTKWNAYGYEDVSAPPAGNVLTYLTAWDGIPKLVAVLSSRFPDVEFQYEYADEDVGFNVGRMDFLDGETVYENIPDAHSKEAYEMAFDIMNCTADSYNLAFDEKAQTYQYQEEMGMQME